MEILIVLRNFNTYITYIHVDLVFRFTMNSANVFKYFEVRVIVLLAVVGLGPVHLYRKEIDRLATVVVAVVVVVVAVAMETLVAVVVTDVRAVVTGLVVID